ncbi:MAG: helix-turn-helix domain-containing protein [Planctomycetota bacterium]
MNKPPTNLAAFSSTMHSIDQDRLMNQARQKRMQAAGWKVGTTPEFLGLTTSGSLLIEVKLALVDAVRARRRKLGLTQAELGKLMRSSQSRVAKMESGDGTVSIDLLVHALVSLGITRKQLARALDTAAA